MKKMRILTAFLTIALLAGCTAPAAPPQGSPNAAGQAEQLIPIRVVLDWTPNTNHTGMYVALEKGWYEEAGLDVTIMQPPEETALGLVGAGRAEFAVGFQESIGPALASASPLPVTAVAAILQHNTSGILTLAESGIQSPKDLCGKKFATWGGALVDETIRTIVEGDGGVFEEVEMVFDEATDAISALQTRIDAIWVYYGWDGIAAKLAGVECSYMDFAQLEPVFDFYSPVLVAGDAWLAAHPDQAAAFLGATARGYEFAIENPQQAGEILLQYAPELGRDLVLESQAWLAGQYRAEAAAWGTIDPQRWSGFYAWMYDRGLLERELGQAGFSNDYLPR